MHIHNPTQQDGQGEDIGTQYISAIFCCNKEQKKTAEGIIAKEQEEVEKEGKKIYTIIREDGVFYEAEEYHHNYYNIRGRENPYCDIIPPKIQKLRTLFKDLVK